MGAARALLLTTAMALASTTAAADPVYTFCGTDPAGRAHTFDLSTLANKVGISPLGSLALCHHLCHHLHHLLLHLLHVCEGGPTVPVPILPQH